MALYLINGGRQLVQFQEGKISELAYPALPGCQIKQYQDERATILIKEVRNDLFSIRYNTFRFSERQRIESAPGVPGLHSTVMLQNGMNLRVDPIGNIVQEEGTVSLFSGRMGACSAVLEPGIEYRSLHVYGGEELSFQLSRFFPGLLQNQEFIQNLFPFPGFMSPGVNKVIDEILDCPYDKDTSEFFFDVKVREYFYMLLKDCFRSQKSKYRFTPYDEQQIHKARELLLSDLSKPPLRIKELARKVSLNEFKLKAGFTHFFKAGVFECFQRARMYRARQFLLQTNKPIKEICTLAGYPRMTNFITAFRNHFGRTPGALRRS